MFRYSLIKRILSTTVQSSKRLLSPKYLINVLSVLSAFKKKRFAEVRRNRKNVFIEDKRNGNTPKYTPIKKLRLFSQINERPLFSQFDFPIKI